MKSLSIGSTGKAFRNEVADKETSSSKQDRAILVSLNCLNLTIAAILVSSPTFAGECSPPKPLRFLPGRTSSTIRSVVARGEQECWSLGARAGQRLTIIAFGPQGNAVFQLYRPGWQVAERGGAADVTGRALVGTEPGSDAHSWVGRLSISGSYLVVVGPLGEEQRIISPPQFDNSVQEDVLLHQVH